MESMSKIHIISQSIMTICQIFGNTLKTTEDIIINNNKLSLFTRLQSVTVQWCVLLHRHL